jgi:hypothetical protein
MLSDFTYVNIFNSLIAIHILSLRKPMQPLLPCHTKLTPFFAFFSFFRSLINTLKRRYSLALILIQRMTHHSSVSQLDFTLRLLLEGQRVLHPFLVVSLGVVLSCVRAAGFLPCSGRLSGLDT